MHNLTTLTSEPVRQKKSLLQFQVPIILLITSLSIFAEGKYIKALAEKKVCLCGVQYAAMTKRTNTASEFALFIG